MFDHFRYRTLLDTFERTEKMMRLDVYNYLNKQLRHLIQTKSKKNRKLIDMLTANKIKWHKFRGLEEIEAIPISKTQYADSTHNPLKYRKPVMAAALQRVLSWHRCSEKKIIWITPNRTKIQESGFTRNCKVIPYPQDFDTIIKILRRNSKYVLVARPAILAQLAFHINKYKIAPPKPSLLIAFNHDITIGAETLLKKTFNVPIVRLLTDTHYGSLIATCQYDYYHLFEPIAIQEVVNERGLPVTSGRGTLVSTPLHTSKPTLLRFDTEIEVIPNQNAVCPCGLSYRTIDNLSYVSRPTLKSVDNQDLLIPLPEELHPNIVGVNYEQSYAGEVLITVKENEIGSLNPNDYKEWFHNYWKLDIRIILLIDNRSTFLGDRGLSNYQIKTT
ncbi:MAG: hypothetical protein RBR35_08385 [Salinivirgaceae bacterium]|nr:hypothetical protein [Salinivirgaceae bacterium]